jgi:glycerophosphoryl diester phosphodiesterase
LDSVLSFVAVKRVRKITIYRGILILSCLFTAACFGQTKFDTQAHRGGRGLMPENTIPAMLDAIDRGVTTLEMDLQLTRDGQVVVSHDPTFNANFVTTPEGDTLTSAAAKKIVLHQLSYDSIAKYDVGLKFNHEFPRQKKVSAVKPLLSVLLDSTEAYAKAKGRTIHYNIEIKSRSAGDGIYYPDLAGFVDAAMQVIRRKGMADKVVIQSFDTRALQLLHSKYPQYALSYLIDAKEKRSPNQLIDALGFKPAILSPNSALVTPEMINNCHQQKLKVIPWTVNDLEEIRKLKKMGVDGIITDYPDLFSRL